MSNIKERITLRLRSDWLNFYFDSATDADKLITDINAAKSGMGLLEIRDHRGQHRYVDVKEVLWVDRGHTDFSEYDRPKRKWTGYVMPSQKYFS